MAESNVSDALESFYTIFNVVVSASTPLKRYFSSTYPSWFNGKLISLLIRKKIAHRNYKLSKSEIDYNIFKTLRTSCKTEATLCYEKFIEGVERSVLSNINFFWDYINIRRNTKGYPSNMSLNDKHEITSQQITNLFADFFKEDPNTVSGLCQGLTCIDSDAPFDPISESELTDALKDLKPNLSSRAGGIPAFLIKGSSTQLIRPLCVLFNLSLREGALPEIWKTTFITPIFKNGDRSKIGNYRPIAIISAIPKLLDKIMFEDVFRYYFSESARLCSGSFHNY